MNAHAPLPLPLESFNLSVLPKTTHNIAWSPDGELAIGCDDSVWVYLPDFTLSRTRNSNNSNNSSSTYAGPRQYEEAALRFPIAPLKSAELNRHVFAAVGQPFRGYSFFTGGGDGVLSGHGSTLNHAVALAWSPCGLGRMNRAVLAVLTAAGVLTVYCQGAAEDIMTAGKRTLKPWTAAWHIGAGFLLPETVDKREYITAFAWAKDTGRRAGAKVLAYMNDDYEVVVLSVRARHVHAPGVTPGDIGQWKVVEVARFMAHCPHPILDPNDPDYICHGSSFALSWSPWLRRGSSKTSILSYITHNYAGFRQITIDDGGGAQDVATVQVGRVDASGVCLYLSPDAFVVWEDKIWMRPGSSVCRGIIASPATVHAFEIPFDYTSPVGKHSTDQCNTTYPPEEDQRYVGNPITGLIIHPPSMAPNSSTPAYTLVRLSATFDNPTWHQTNLPSAIDDEQHHYNLSYYKNLRWATEINQAIEHQLPLALARRQNQHQHHRQHQQEEEEEEEESEFDSEDEDDDDGFDDDPGVGVDDAEDQVHVTRVRIWGMAASPGGGTSAVFVSLHSALELERDTFAGLKCRVLFGTHQSPSSSSSIIDTTDSCLSTEARAWEWMYAGGRPVPGFSSSCPSAAGGQKSTKRTGGDDYEHDDSERQALRDQFRILAQRQRCVFCDSVPLTAQGGSSSTSVCPRGHVFENCANTGVPITAPNVSNTCGVCGMKCLKAAELLEMAPHLKDIIDEDISAEHCGGCGGKFLN
ncbi:hypothetical protein F5Y17DRAFT_409285 [Xylariaceae sp. FL0594]|nr:hypothetical protein F5Y17DRAFT_409285 [Xylariaceae sp. FL0594]